MGNIDQNAVAENEGVARKFESGGREIERSPTRFFATGPLKRSHGIETDNFKYLASVTSRTPKLCIPSPTILHMRGGRDAVDKKAYPDIDGFFTDLAQVYREEIRGLTELGCRRSFFFFCSARYPASLKTCAWLIAE